MNSSLPSKAPARLFFLLLPQVHVLDFSGPLQVFYEANGFGANYSLRFCGNDPRVRTAQGLWLSDLEPLMEVSPSDTILVPGLDSETLHDLDHVPISWLRQASQMGARICSICSGAFVLAHAGLLDGRRCTTHWKVASRLQETYPATRVVKNRLFVRDGNITTSAGLASGIDMALALVEEEHGPLMVGRTAREMVVYLRRHGASEQMSVFMDYRTHLHPGIHRVQDWIIAHPEEKVTIQELARNVGMSPRNLTRIFRQATGITLKNFTHQVKLELAGNLLRNPDLTFEDVASHCGFSDSRQLRRLWKRMFGLSPSAWRSREEERTVS